MDFKKSIRAAWRDQEIARLMGVAMAKQARKGKAPSHKVIRPHISGTGYDGQLWLLVHEGDDAAGVYEGETVRSFLGEDYVLTGGRPPHKPASTGKVWTSDGGEFYPGVFKLRWIHA